jgi:hypothetical protein
MRAAGVSGSPAILMSSGTGPADEPPWVWVRPILDLPAPTAVPVAFRVPLGAALVPLGAEVLSHLRLP